MLNELRLPQIFLKVPIRARPDIVYDAISTQAGLEAWLCTQALVDCRVGGMLRLCWRDFGPDLLNVEDGGEIVECNPPRVFSFQWRPGSSTTTVRFELKDLDAQTVVELTESGHTVCQEDINALVDCSAGWGEALTRLKVFVEHGIRL